MAGASYNTGMNTEQSHACQCQLRTRCQALGVCQLRLSGQGVVLSGYPQIVI
jgi:hypothetical protein